MPTEIQLSICCITYNHAKYIEQCLHGFLMQKVNFPVEVVIFDDCSTDGTSDIITRLLPHFGENVVYKRFEKNVGIMPNFWGAIQQCKGKYIALCEGDDYWTDVYKLQKQVDFLEKNLGYAICFHKVRSSLEHKVASDITPNQYNNSYSIYDLAKKNFMYTPSVVFKNNLIQQLPVWVNESPVGDYILHMLNAQHGLIKYLPEEMAVYTIHEGGYWSTLSAREKTARWIKTLDLLLREPFDEKVLELLQKQKAETIKAPIIRAIKKRQWEQSQALLKEFVLDDKQLSIEWLLHIYPEIIKDIQSGQNGQSGLIRRFKKYFRWH